MVTRNAFLLVISSLVLACSGAMGGGDFEKQQEPGLTDPAGDEDTGGDPTADPDSGDPSTPGTDTGATTKPTTDSGTTTTDTGTPATDTAPPPSDPPVSGLPLISNLSIGEVAFFQGVKVSVAKSGSKVATRAAPVIAGREALVRVYLAPAAGWSPREVVGELKLVSASGGTKTYSASITPSAASSDATLTSTLNFNVPTGVLAVDSTYSVSLFAKSGTVSGDTSGARYPTSGSTESLDAKGTGETLKIKIVPIQYNADGSGRLPATDATQVERYRQAFYAMYPAKNVEVTVRAPYAYSSAISANGSGFSTALNAMVKLRQTDGAPKDVYYYGAFASASSFGTYCGGGCVTGLCGLLTYPSDATGRACVGIGYSGAQAANTAAHEIGHAHGRAHAPCGTSDSDSKYPYSGGTLGVWGYDLVNKVLKSPTTFKDFMGYCDPTWISDYTFNAIATRMSTVSASAFVSVAKDATFKYRFVNVGMDGKLEWGDSITLSEPPLAEPHTISYLGDDGSTVETTTGFYYPYNDLPGGYMLVPELPISAKGIQVSGFAPSIESRLIRTP
jgi:hypothetical protein